MAKPTYSRLTIVGVAMLTGIGLFAGAQSVQAATTIDGPIDLGTATTYGALAASGLTNTGPTVVNGDIGISPGTATAPRYCGRAMIPARTAASPTANCTRASVVWRTR